MGRFIDLTGRIFGELKVLSLNSKGIRTKWNCLCNCGKECVVEAYNLTRGHSKSCGCIRISQFVSRNTKHGLSSHPLSHIYGAILIRCTNPSHKFYKNYGGRGITMCPEWLADRTRFIKWCQDNGWRIGLDLDRIDNNKGYSPGNIRFVTRRINLNNKTTTIYFDYKGEKKTAYELELISGIPSSIIFQRLRKRKLPMERALTQPIRKTIITKKRSKRAA